MTPYKSILSKECDVVAYSLTENSITVKFNTGEIRVYTHQSAGICAVENMRKRALENMGLSTYIQENAPVHEQPLIQF